MIKKKLALKSESQSSDVLLPFSSDVPLHLNVARCHIKQWEVFPEISFLLISTLVPDFRKKSCPFTEYVIKALIYFQINLFENSGFI